MIGDANVAALASLLVERVPVRALITATKTLICLQISGRGLVSSSAANRVSQKPICPKLQPLIVNSNGHLQENQRGAAGSPDRWLLWKLSYLKLAAEAG